MAGERLVFGDAGGGGINRLISSGDSSSSIFGSSAASNSFLGSRTMVSFGAVGGVKRSGSSFYGSYDQEEITDEYLDEYLTQQEKKRRLSVEQVQFLEKNFETENKLEPDRKIQLAKELGLKPRQIAIWFQNRRARWKTKQMETDYETLHASFEDLKANYDKILKENERLKSEVLHFKHGGFHGDTRKSNLEVCVSEELHSDVMPSQVTPDMIAGNEKSEVLAVTLGNEEQSSAKSDLTDTDSPRLTDNVANSRVLESGESSSLVFELNFSNILQRNREDDNRNEGYLEHAYSFPKIDDTCVITPANSSYYGFPVEDHHTFSFWSS